MNGVTFHCMMFQAQMVRRVKSYLKNMKLITDEEKLHAMSAEIEPPAGGLPANSHSQSSVILFYIQCYQICSEFGYFM